MSHTTLQRRDPADPLPDEGSLEDEAREIFADPDGWMKRHNADLAGRTPQDCIDQGDLQPVRDLLRRIKHVPYT